MSEWHLAELKIEKLSSWDQKRHGTDKTHAGRVTFRNDTFECFTLNIPPDRVQVFLDAVADLVVAEADLLGSRMRQSLLPAPPTEDK